MYKTFTIDGNVQYEIIRFLYEPDIHEVLAVLTRSNDSVFGADHNLNGVIAYKGDQQDHEN